MFESPRQQTHRPWMRELQVLDDDAGLDDVALAVDQQRELAQRPVTYASPPRVRVAATGSIRPKTCQWIQRLGFYSPDIRRSP